MLAAALESCMLAIVVAVQFHVSAGLQAGMLYCQVAAVALPLIQNMVSLALALWMLGRIAFYKLRVQALALQGKWRGTVQPAPGDAPLLLEDEDSWREDEEPGYGPRQGHSELSEVMDSGARAKAIQQLPLHLATASSPRCSTEACTAACTVDGHSSSSSMPSTLRHIPGSQSSSKKKCVSVRFLANAIRPGSSTLALPTNLQLPRPAVHGGMRQSFQGLARIMDESCRAACIGEAGHDQELGPAAERDSKRLMPFDNAANPLCLQEQDATTAGTKDGEDHLTGLAPAAGRHMHLSSLLGSRRLVSMIASGPTLSSPALEEERMDEVLDEREGSVSTSRQLCMSYAHEASMAFKQGVQGTSVQAACATSTSWLNTATGGGANPACPGRSLPKKAASSMALMKHHLPSKISTRTSDTGFAASLGSDVPLQRMTDGSFQVAHAKRSIAQSVSYGPGWLPPRLQKTSRHGMQAHGTFGNQQLRSPASLALRVSTPSPHPHAVQDARGVTAGLPSEDASREHASHGAVDVYLHGVMSQAASLSGISAQKLQARAVKAWDEDQTDPRVTPVPFQDASSEQLSQQLPMRARSLKKLFSMALSSALESRSATSMPGMLPARLHAATPVQDLQHERSEPALMAHDRA